MYDTFINKIWISIYSSLHYLTIKKATTWNIKAQQKNPILHKGKVDTSEEKVDTSEEKVDTSERKVDTFCSEDTIIRYKSHLKRNELEQLIMENAKEYVSLEEIASRTGKKASYLKNKIIPEMVRSNKLERMYDDTPNHPEQKYKTKE